MKSIVLILLFCLLLQAVCWRGIKKKEVELKESPEQPMITELQIQQTKAVHNPLFTPSNYTNPGYYYDVPEWRLFSMKGKKGFMITDAKQESEKRWHFKGTMLILCFKEWAIYEQHIVIPKQGDYVLEAEMMGKNLVANMFLNVNLCGVHFKTILYSDKLLFPSFKKIGEAISFEPEKQCYLQIVQHSIEAQNQWKGNIQLLITRIQLIRVEIVNKGAKNKKNEVQQKINIRKERKNSFQRISFQFRSLEKLSQTKFVTNIRRINSQENIAKIKGIFRKDSKTSLLNENKIENKNITNKEKPTIQVCLKQPFNKEKQNVTIPQINVRRFKEKKTQEQVSKPIVYNPQTKSKRPYKQFGQKSMRDLIIPQAVNKKVKEMKTQGVKKVRKLQDKINYFQKNIQSKISAAKFVAKFVM